MARLEPNLPARRRLPALGVRQWVRRARSRTSTGERNGAVQFGVVGEPPAPLTNLEGLGSHS
jgi:hypothetical protein